MEGVRSLIFYSPNCTVSVFLSIPVTSCCPVFTVMFLTPTHSFFRRSDPALQFCLIPAPPPLCQSCFVFSSCLTSLSPSNVPSLTGIRNPAGWQADGTDEDGRDWLIPNLLSPCHSGPQRRKREAREKEGEGDGASQMEPAVRWRVFHGPAHTTAAQGPPARLCIIKHLFSWFQMQTQRCLPRLCAFLLPPPPHPPTHKPLSLSLFLSFPTSSSFSTVPPFPHSLVEPLLDLVKINGLLLLVFA